ncbi:MAG: T9SS type A sorting domain-containing protein [Bacteroidota bacterium]
MTRFVSSLFLAALVASASVSAQTCTDGVQSSGALYEYCVPPGPTPSVLVLYAHGYIFPQQPLTLPSASGDGAGVLGLALSNGFAYGASSYYANGLVLPDLAVDDLREVVDLYTAQYGAPERVYLVGFSNGALISTVALENYPDELDGALASCGPLDSYPNNVDYFGDVFVVFDAIFPDALDSLFGVEAGTPGAITSEFFNALVAAAAAAEVTPVQFIAGYLQGVLADPANAASTGQVLGILAATPGIQAAFNDPTEGVTTIISAMLFNVFAGNQAADVLGGNPYGNMDRLYASPFGPDFDAAFNATVPRYMADADARADLEDEFETVGELRDPVIALHTTRDGVVPYWQSVIYNNRVKNTLAFDLRPIERYGHCAFAPEEIGAAFADLLGSRAPGCDYVFEADAVGGTSVGSGGGRLSFAFGLDNTANDEDATIDVWISVRDADGNVIRVRALRQVTVGAGRVMAMRLGQRVPASLPDGTYTYSIVAGTFDAENPAASVPCGFETFVVTKGDANALKASAPVALGTMESGQWAELDVEGDLAPAATEAGTVRVAPNPTTGAVAFSFALEAPAEISLRVFDLRGREVATVAEGTLSDGPHALGLVRDLTPGVYVWRLAIGGEVQTGRITVVR